MSWIPRNGAFTSLDFREACNLLGVENLGAGEGILGERILGERILGKESWGNESYKL